jgi:hypothetical protein
VRGNDDGDYNFCLLIGKVLGTFFFLLLFYPDRKRRRLRTRQHYKRARINRKLQAAAAASITRLNVTSYILFILAMCTIGSYPFRPNFRGSSNFYSPKSLHCGSFALVSFLLLFFFVSFISFHVSFLFSIGFFKSCIDTQYLNSSMYSHTRR